VIWRGVILGLAGTIGTRNHFLLKEKLILQRNKKRLIKLMYRIRSITVKIPVGIFCFYRLANESESSY
jgi:hypothetical protein